MNFSKVSLLSLEDAYFSNSLVIVSKVSDWTTDHFDEVLNIDELLRRQRFLNDKDKHRYSVAHGIKRHVLARYLNVAPSSLTFSKLKYGKPYCNQPKAPCFSLSHSADWIVIAVSKLSEVGVDIEFPRSINHCELVKKVCSIEQQSIYGRASDKLSTFLTLWVKKEAIAKVCGRGLAVGLRSIEVHGNLGVESIRFDSLDYRLHSFIHAKGFISYASLSLEKPIFVQIV